MPALRSLELDEHAARVEGLPRPAGGRGGARRGAHRGPRPRPARRCGPAAAVVGHPPRSSAGSAVHPGRPPRRPRARRVGHGRRRRSRCANPRPHGQRRALTAEETVLAEVARLVSQGTLAATLRRELVDELTAVADDGAAPLTPCRPAASAPGRAARPPGGDDLFYALLCRARPLARRPAVAADYDQAIAAGELRGEASTSSAPSRVCPAELADPRPQPGEASRRSTRTRRAAPRRRPTRGGRGPLPGGAAPGPRARGRGGAAPVPPPAPPWRRRG